MAHKIIRSAIVLLLCLLGWPNFATAQSYTIAPSPFLTIQNNSGAVISGGCVWTYTAGTTTAATTYSDSAGTTNTNPIIADSAGRFTAYLTPGSSYKFVYENTPCSASTHGTTLRTADNIGAVPTSGLNVDITGTAGVTVSAGDVVYLSDGSGSLTQGQWYKADATLYYASIHPQIGIATGAITAASSGTIRIAGTVTGLTGLTAGSTYYVSGTAAGLTVTAPANARKVGQALSTTSLVMDVGPAWVVDAGQALGIADGRLTLTSGTAVTTSDVLAAGTLYYTPYKGNRIALFDGNKWKAYSFSEISLAITCTASNSYDIWLYDNAGTLTLETLIWTNATTRATAIALQNGVYVKSGATTRRYLGSFYCTAMNQTEDSLARRMLWNYYNRIPRILRRLETTSQWTYSTATIRQANNSTLNQVDMMIGVAEVQLDLTLLAVSTNNNADIARAAGIGEDSTTAMMATQSGVGAGGIGATIAANSERIHESHISHYPAIGRHFYSWNEISAATATTTWGGLGSMANPNSYQCGLVGSIQG